MDIIFIEQLEIETIIGVYDWERNIRQKVCLDIQMATDIRKAGATDDLNYALDYAAISERIVGFVENSRFLLIESLAEQISAILLDEFSIPWVKLTIGKPGAVSKAKIVGLVIERGQLG
ncbi:MAG: dihydroneopterin aldolase [Pseudomonadales bacterium]|jgi:dihydroneopterin aldolase